MKAYLLLTALAVSIAGFAAPAKKAQADDPCEKPAYVPLRDQINLYETRDTDCGINLGVRADLLYMNYSCPVITYASQGNIVGAAPATLNSTILGLPGQMSLGCNLALSYTMANQPGYSFETSWYYVDATFSRSNSGEGVLLAHSVALTTRAPGSVRAKSHLIINFFDLMMKKSFSFGDWFKIAPSAGLMGGFMHSNNRASTEASTATTFGNGTTVASLNQFIDYEGIGLKIGGCSSFKIWQGLRLTADLFYSVMYGYTKANLEYSSNGSFSGLGFANSNYKHHHGRALFDSLLGLAWENRFRNDSIYLDVHAGWRFQSFSDGWMEYEAEFNDSLFSLPLYGQGLQIGATVKF